MPSYITERMIRAELASLDAALDQDDTDCEKLDQYKVLLAELEQLEWAVNHESA